MGEVPPGSDPYWASSTTQVWPVGVFFLLPILDFELDVLCFVDHMNQLLQLSCSSSKMTFYLSGTLPSQVLGKWMNARWYSFVSRYVHYTSLAPKEGHHWSLNILAEEFKTYIYASGENWPKVVRPRRDARMLPYEEVVQLLQLDGMGSRLQQLCRQAVYGPHWQGHSLPGRMENRTSRSSSQCPLSRTSSCRWMPSFGRRSTTGTILPRRFWLKSPLALQLFFIV